MFDFKKAINSLKFSMKFNEDLPRQFLQKAHLDSKQNAVSIKEQIKLIAGVEMKLTDTRVAEVAAAVIGTSLGLLTSGGSAMMTAYQGKKVLQLCKKSNLKDTKASLEDAKAFQKGIDEYIEGFKKSFAIKTNPFNQPAGILLMEFAGKEADKIFMPEQPTILNPLLHQTTMDLLALMTLEPLKIFKK